MSASIFISYASQDQKVATTLCKALESRNFKCWIAARDIAPGENFQIAIVRAIRAAKIMLLVFTGNSNNSDEMAKELALASQSKLIVVPLLIDDVRPNDAFSYEFATRQWIDFFSDWETAIEQLAQRIAVALGPDTAAASAAPIAPLPEPLSPAPTPDVIMQALAAQPAEVAAPLAPAELAPVAQAPVDPTGQTAIMPAAALAEAAPMAPAAVVPPFEPTGPSSFQDPVAVKRGAPIGLIIALSLLVVVAIAAAAVVLPSFLAPKPAPPPVATAAPVVTPANPPTALTTTQSPAPMPPAPTLTTQPTAATPGPAPMASDMPQPPAIPVPTPPARLRHFAPAADAPEDPDLDPETHPARGRHRGGESADVPY